MKRKKKRKKKGFTLIELLAVIIILGVLMIIAIPSVTEYIQSSRKSAYVTTATQYISGARVKVNSAEIPMYDTSVTYYLPTSCIPLEKGGDSPFGEIEEAYVVVTYDGNGYDYYFTARDSSNMGMLLTSEYLLDNERIESGIKSVNTQVGIEGHNTIHIMNDCGKINTTELAATTTIPSKGKLEENTEIETPSEDPEEEKDTLAPTVTMTSEVNEYLTNDVSITISNIESRDYPITIEYYIKLASASDDTYSKVSSKTITEGTTDNYRYTGLDSSSSYTLKVVVKDASNNQTSDTKTAGIQCFLAGTKVLTETGLKNIEDLKQGELVYSINLDNNQKELKEITALYIGNTNEIYEIEIGEEIVKTTPKHEFYIVDKGWVRAHDLEIGDELVSSDGEKMKIKKIIHKTNISPQTIYNLTVEGNHNYLITEYRLLVHNASPTEGEIPEF